MIDRLDELFLRVRRSPFLYRFTLFTRILLAAGFIPTGMVKVLGHRFSQISVELPIGAFFEAMYQTGLYWRFLGASQIVAGGLLLIPAFAHLGAAAFLPIMVNILVITVALQFTGTPLVTAAMVLAVLYLCAWDYHRFRGLITLRPAPDGFPPVPLRLDPWERTGFALFAVGLLAFCFVTRSFLPTAVAGPSLILATLAGLVTLGRYLAVGRRLGPDHRASRRQ